MKKNVIIGSLVAGAFLLPALAGAGVVTGRCDKCHTMHASQDGNTSTPNANLLRGNGCLACHAQSGVVNNASGVGGTFTAPQVHDGTTNTLSGGYFSAGSVDSQHNVAGFANEDAAFGGPTYDIPGNSTNMTAQIICQDCHLIAGHHAAPTTYRMLGYGAGPTAVAGTGAADYGVAGRSGNAYDGATMNALCANCHGDFHGVVGGAELGNYGGWLRHPTDITLTEADTNTTGRNYAADYAAAAGAADATPTGVGGTVMCLSCHRAHGNANLDLIEWDQAAVLAGNANTQDGGCENCHTYGTDGY